MEMKRKVMNVIKKGAERNVNQSVAQTCVWVCHQPKAPKNLTKIKSK